MWGEIVAKISNARVKAVKKLAKCVVSAIELYD